MSESDELIPWETTGTPDAILEDVIHWGYEPVLAEPEPAGLFRRVMHHLWNILPLADRFQAIHWIFVEDADEDVALFLAETGNEPAIVLNLNAWTETTERSPLDQEIQAQLSILHELGHALLEQEGLGGEDDEVEEAVERFARVIVQGTSSWNEAVDELVDRLDGDIRSDEA